MHLESGLSQKGRPSVEATEVPMPSVVPVSPERRPRARAPRLGEFGKRQTLNVFTVDGRDVSAEVGSEEAVVDETAFIKQPSVIFTRGKKVRASRVPIQPGRAALIGNVCAMSPSCSARRLNLLGIQVNIHGL